MAVFQQDVPTGASVGVEIVNCEDLTCEAESSPRQLILVPFKSAAWWWSITAGQPGSAEITVRADTYDQGTQQILSEELFNIPGTVLATAPFNHQRRHHAIAAVAHIGIIVAATIGSLAGSILAIAGVVSGILAWRRRRKRTSEQPSGEQGQSDAEVEQPPASDGSPDADGRAS